MKLSMPLLSVGVTGVTFLNAEEVAVVVTPVVEIRGRLQIGLTSTSPSHLTRRT
jgi:hypothetical protein